MSSLATKMAADAMYAKVVHFVRETQQCSVLHISRTLRCGFGNAARYIEQLAQDGVVSGLQADGRRTVLPEYTGATTQ